MTDKSIRVTLREQKNKSGRTSLYLDFYPAIYDEKKKKDTRRKFMDLYVFEKPANKMEREHNKYTMIKANIAIILLHVAVFVSSFFYYLRGWIKSQTLQRLKFI